jgi:putative ABC transport system permease protein
MKKTAQKDALRNIKKRIVSWLSMVTIVLIGTSVILGLFFTSRSLSYCGNQYLTQLNAKTMDLACSLGVREAELDRVLQIEGIKDVEGVISFTGQINAGTRNNGITLVSDTEHISVPYVTAGQRPQAGNECALNPDLAEKLGVNIGDEITFTAASSRLANTLINEKYIVTGFMIHPEYITSEMVDYCILPKASFDTEGAAFDYTNIYIDLDAMDHLNYTDDKLSDEINLIRGKIEDILPEMTSEHIKNLSEELDREYEKAETEVNKKLSDAKAEIDSAQKEFDEKIGEAEKKLTDGESELKEGKDKAERELAAGWKKIQDGEKEYNEKIADGQRQLEDGEKQMEKELENARFKLFAGMLEIDKNKKLLAEKEDQYNQGVERYKLGEAELIAARQKLDDGWAQYDEGMVMIDEALPSEVIHDVAELLYEAELEDPANDLEQVADLEPLERAIGVLGVYDYYVDEEVRHFIDDVCDVGEYRNKIDDAKSARQRLYDGEDEYHEGEHKLESAKTELEDGRRQLDQGWYSIEQAEKELANGELEYNRKEPEARAQLAAKKEEFEQKKAEGAKELEDAKKTYAAKKKEAMDEIAVHEKELEDGRAEFEAERDKGQAQLDDAWEQYYSGKKEAEEKLADVKAQIEKGKKTDCEWFVQTLDANLYFMELKSYCQVLNRVFLVFTPIYAGIVIVVCFFTMAIIVEEQSKQIGTCKALGMYKSEVRSKYLLFGITAAILGAAIGIGGGFLFEYIIDGSLETVFVFGAPPHKFDLQPLILVPLGACLATGLAVFWSSEKVLSCSAVGLVSGNEPKKSGRTKAAKGKGKSVYAHLIVNNFLMDAGREIVSVVIILVCVFLIGLGTSIKLGHHAALHNQVLGIYKYDLNVTLSDTITDEERENLLSEIGDLDYIGLGKLGGVIQSDTGQTLTEVFVVDDVDRFREFYELMDNVRRDVPLTEDGLMVTIEMEDKNGLVDGEAVTIITNNLKLAGAAIKGHFLLHVGKAAVMSFDYYRKIFNAEPVINDYMIKVGDRNIDELQEKLESMPGVSEITRADLILDQKAGMSRLYTIVVIIVIVFSIMLSFMILLNLSNILVSHRMKELLTMRVNGFSNGQVIGYLVREILVTTSLGIILGLLIGIPSTGFIMPKLESSGFMFLRKPYVSAWILAVGCNALFSIIINTVSFSKIGKVPLTDITKY